MKVAFVLSQFPCYDEAFLLREIRALAERVDVSIVSLKTSRDPVVHEAARELAPRTFTPPWLLSLDLVGAHLGMLLRRPRRYLRALARTLVGNLPSPRFLVRNLALFPKAVLVARWAESTGVTHLHAGWATHPASVAFVVAELTDLPFSFSAHAHDIYLDTTHLPEKLRRARFTTTCTASNRSVLQDLVPDLGPERLHVVRHGLHLEAYARRPSSPAGAPLPILSVGRLLPHKGFGVLLEGLQALEGRGVDFRCTIVGGGPLESALREAVERLGLGPRVTLTGPRPQEDVVRQLASTEVSVLMAQPEWHWGVPNVIIEALASSHAVVTTRFGSVEELIRDGETGLIVPPRDPQALADALERLATDPTLRRRLAGAGHERVCREYDLRRTTEEYLRLFSEAHEPLTREAVPLQESP